MRRNGRISDGWDAHSWRSSTSRRRARPGPDVRPDTRPARVSRGRSKGRPPLTCPVHRNLKPASSLGLARGVRRKAPHPLASMPVWLSGGRRVLPLVAPSVPAIGASLHTTVPHSHRSQGHSPSRPLPTAKFTSSQSVCGHSSRTGSSDALDDPSSFGLCPKQAALPEIGLMRASPHHHPTRVFDGQGRLTRVSWCGLSYLTSPHPHVQGEIQHPHQDDPASRHLSIYLREPYGSRHAVLQGRPRTHLQGWRPVQVHADLQPGRHSNSRPSGQSGVGLRPAQRTRESRRNRAGHRLILDQFPSDLHVAGCPDSLPPVDCVATAPRFERRSATAATDNPSFRSVIQLSIERFTLPFSGFRTRSISRSWPRTRTTWIVRTFRRWQHRGLFVFPVSHEPVSTERRQTVVSRRSGQSRRDDTSD